MKVRKIALISIVIVLFAAGGIFIRHMVNRRRTIEVIRTINFSEIIDGGTVSDLTLTIYYIAGGLLSTPPLDVERLLALDLTLRVTVSGNRLARDCHLLRQLDEIRFRPVESRLAFAHLHYIFEYNGKTLPLPDGDGMIACSLMGLRLERILHYMKLYCHSYQVDLQMH